MRNYLIKKWLFCLCMVLSLSFVKHDVYLSSMEIVVKPPQKDLQITLRVFTDDLELVLQNQFDSSLHLNPDSAALTIDSLAASYLATVIKIKAANRPVILKLLGKEYRDDLTLLYLEGNLDPSINEFQLTHRLFLDALPTQQNVVHCKQGSQRKSFLFDKRLFEKVLQLNP